MHVFWGMGALPLVDVVATIVVERPPIGADLCFWALQVDFVDHTQSLGAGHFGLQHHAGYPGAAALNWGGYHRGGGELEGSISTLGSAVGNRNTSNYRWQAGVAYRYRIRRSPERGWRGSITDLSTGVETVARDLWIEADHLAQPMVWTECFAPCDAPSVSVVWSDLAARTTEGEVVTPTGPTVNYQSFEDGGCTNTSIERIGEDIRQATNQPRFNASGQPL